MNYDNPAARLLTILQQGKKYDPSTSCRMVWSELLGVKDQNSPALVSRLGKLMELPELIIQALREQYAEQGNTWSYWAGQVNTAFTTQNLNSRWAEFIGKIDDHTLTYLRMSADLLQERTNTSAIADEELVALRDQLDDIYKEVIDAEIDSEVKKYVMHHLRKIMTCIDEYKITGALPLLDAVSATFGQACLDKEYRSFFNEPLGNRLFNALTAVANAVTIAVGIPELTHSIALLTAAAN